MKFLIKSINRTFFEKLFNNGNSLTAINCPLPLLNPKKTTPKAPFPITSPLDHLIKYL